MVSSLTPMEYLLIGTQNIFKISLIEMQLNGPTTGSISRVYLQMFVDITAYLTFTIVVIMFRLILLSICFRQRSKKIMMP